MGRVGNWVTHLCIFSEPLGTLQIVAAGWLLSPNSFSSNDCPEGVCSGGRSLQNDVHIDVAKQVFRETNVRMENIPWRLPDKHA